MAIQLSVSINKVEITSIDTINQGEYGVNQCEFTFTQEFNNLTKRAVFTNVLGKSYLVEIENDTCEIPAEALALAGDIRIGVYAYEVDENDELVLRYSPTYTKFSIAEGSYISKVSLSDKTMEDVFEEIIALQTQISNIIAQIGAMNGQIRTMDGQITNIDMQITSINTNLATINNTLTELNNKSIIVAE